MNTELLETHRAQSALIVDFAGWSMPLHYGSQIEEHHAVRTDAGMFDVSHMAVVDIEGARAKEFLRYLLANDVEKLKTIGQALYSCMLNESGGIIDDLIVYRLNTEGYRLVINAGTTQKDLAWLQQQAAAFSVTVCHRRSLSIIAIQGPRALEKASTVFSATQRAAVASLQSFTAVEVEGWFIARTGYTGESGLEVILPTTAVVTFWQALLKAGVRPCGLGARDTLRLEAGLNLYGLDMDETTTPFASHLGWTVDESDNTRDFIGRKALSKTPDQVLVGLVLEGRGVLRHGQTVVLSETSHGMITSGTFSPTLQRGIALARVPSSIGKTGHVDIRGQHHLVHVVTPPFVKKGQANF